MRPEQSYLLLLGKSYFPSYDPNAGPEGVLAGGMPVEGVCPTLADYVRGVGRGEEATCGPAHLGQAVAEAVAVAAVRAELAQSHDAGPALGEATGVISLHGGRDQGVEVLRGRQIQGRGSWGGQRHSDREERVGQVAWLPQE